MRRAFVVLVLVLAGCSVIRERSCMSAGGWIIAADVCRLPSNAIACPWGFPVRDEHDFYADCAHRP
jgi:hypothetical protein